MKYYKIIYIINILFFFYYFTIVLNGNISNERINNFESNITNKDYLSKLKKVVFTALIGNYDKIHKINKEKGYDYFMFTDRTFKNNSNLNWTILPLKKRGKLSKKKIYKLQRFYKTHPHLFFENYDLSIYIDTSYEIKGKLDEFLLRILSSNLNIYLLEHPDRNSIYKEMNAVVSYKKESKKVVSVIRKRYKKHDFPDDIGLSENSLIVRKHKEKDCIDLMNRWFNEINKYSHRDQLSFGYILWKTRYKKVKYIPKRIIYEYFNKDEFHLKNITFKNY